MSFSLLLLSRDSLANHSRFSIQKQVPAFTTSFPTNPLADLSSSENKSTFHPSQTRPRLFHHCSWCYSACNSSFPHSPSNFQGSSPIPPETLAYSAEGTVFPLSYHNCLRLSVSLRKLKILYIELQSFVDEDVQMKKVTSLDSESWQGP